METPELAAFVTVAETGSFSIAAEGLHLTQSAVSRRIAGLEKRLDARLFDRVGRSVALTEAGRALLPRARRILADLDDTRTLIRNLTGAVSGALTLATSHHIGLHRLPPVLRTFSRTHPEVRLDLEFLDSETAHDLLLQGRLELAVVTLAPAGVPPLASHAIWDDPLVFAVGRDHGLAERPRVTLEALAAEPAVLPGMGTYTGRIVARTFADAGLELPGTLTTNYLETIRMMASVGLGWTVLPASMLDDRLVRLNPVGVPVLRRTLGWVSHPERTPSNAARAFVEVLESFGDPDLAVGRP
ncbi:MAG TPA: LysR family transcriptional regulator [Pseudomonadales bacterium]|nr:LysR family transcriptional regulator [Pseudomonadales bacterium]